MRDLEIISTELLAKDIETAEKYFEKVKGELRRAPKDKARQDENVSVFLPNPNDPTY